MDALSAHIFQNGVVPATQSAVADFASLRPRTDASLRPPVSTGRAPGKRTRIWELHHNLYCSIIGTCLSTGELRRVLRRLDVTGAATADDHGVHQLGVILAGDAKGGGRHLQKSLDRLHKRAIDQFAKAKDEAAVGVLWDEAVRCADIPASYWAVLTHSATTEALVKRVFGEVHMLSHLVGAANRADIVRLRRLEQENSTLSATLERQQRQLRDGFVSRDATIARLTEALARRAEEATNVGDAEGTAALTQALAEHERRLVRERSRCESLERRLEKALAERDRADRARRLAEGELESLRAELAAAEYQIGLSAGAGSDRRANQFNLDGTCILYVGGRPHQVTHLRDMVERAKGRFLHHDGGLEHNAAMLPALVTRADIVLFPVDCVSHKAAATIKRTCSQLGRRYVPLRTSSLTCLLSGLTNQANDGSSRDSL